MNPTPDSDDGPPSNGRLRHVWTADPNPGTDVHALPNDLLTTLDPLVLLDIVGPRHVGDEAISPTEQAFAGLHLLTFIVRGTVEHHDSLGNHDVVSAGEMLTLSVGAGFVQQEVLRGDDDGIVHVVRVGIRMPPDQEQDQWPYWYLVPQILNHPERRVVEHLIAGWSGSEEIQETMGDLQIPHLRDMRFLRLEPGGSLTFPEWSYPADPPEKHVVVVADGSVEFGSGELLTQGAIAVIADIGPEVGLVSPDGATLLTLRGSRFGAPLATDFGFVMSDEDALRRAWDDYAAGRMGRVAEGW